MTEKRNETALKLRRLALWAAGVAGGLVLIGAFVYGIHAMNASDDAANRAEAAKFALANTICGSSPRRIKTHGASWNFGPWIEVDCQNGTMKAIRL